jgi:hypothetical protein
LKYKKRYGRQGDKGTRRQGDKETRRQGDKETRETRGQEARERLLATFLLNYFPTELLAI